MVALALLAPAGASGSAGFSAEAFPATMSGKQEGSATLGIGSGLLNVTCKTASFSGSIALPEGPEALSVTPSYAECTAAGVAATVTTTGCKYVLNSGEETSADAFSGSVGLSCESGKSIVISAVTCEVQISGQSGLKTIKYSDNTEASPKRFTTTMSLAAIKYTVTKDGIFCPLAGTGGKEDGILSQVDLVTASTAEVATGTFVLSKTKLCAAKEFKCTAMNTYKVGTFLEGTSTKNVFKDLAGFEVTCETSGLSGKTGTKEGDAGLGFSTEVLFWGGLCQDSKKRQCFVKAPAALPFSGWVATTEAKNGVGMVFVSPETITITCAAPALECEYEKVGGVGMIGKGGAPAVLELRSWLILQNSTGTEKCSGLPNWEANYVLESPKTVYFTY